MAKYIIHYALKKGDSENSDLEKKIQKVSASCEKIATATFIIDSEKTARRIIGDLASVMDIKSNLKEEFYTALPAALYDTIGADSERESQFFYNTEFHPTARYSKKNCAT